MIERDSNIPVETSTVQPTPAQDAKPAQTVPVVAVVLAAGFGTRSDSDNPKQLILMGDEPIVCWSIDVSEHRDRIDDVAVVVSPKVRGEVETLVGEMDYTKVHVIIDGGDEHMDNTATALDVLATAGIPDDARILIYDIVRPFVEQSAIDGSIDAFSQFTAVTMAYASTDIVLLTEDLGNLKVVKSVPDRPNTFRAQTPQSFRLAMIRYAYDLIAVGPSFHPVDDTHVVIDYLPDEPVAIVSGAETNLEITTLGDIPTVRRIAKEVLGRDPKEEAHVYMHILLTQTAGQMHRQTDIMRELNAMISGFDRYDGVGVNPIVKVPKAIAEQRLGVFSAPDDPLEQVAVTVHAVSTPVSSTKVWSTLKETVETAKPNIIIATGLKHVA